MKKDLSRSRRTDSILRTGKHRVSSICGSKLHGKHIKEEAQEHSNVIQCGRRDPAQSAEVILSKNATNP